MLDRNGRSYINIDAPPARHEISDVLRMASALIIVLTFFVFIGGAMIRNAPDIDAKAAHRPVCYGGDTTHKTCEWDIARNDHE